MKIGSLIVLILVGMFVYQAVCQAIVESPGFQFAQWIGLLSAVIPYSQFEADIIQDQEIFSSKEDVTGKIFFGALKEFSSNITNSLIVGFWVSDGSTIIPLQSQVGVEDPGRTSSRDYQSYVDRSFASQISFRLQQSRPVNSNFGFDYGFDPMNFYANYGASLAKDYVSELNEQECKNLGGNWYAGVIKDGVASNFACSSVSEFRENDVKFIQQFPDGRVINGVKVFAVERVFRGWSGTSWLQDVQPVGANSMYDEFVSQEGPYKLCDGKYSIGIKGASDVGTDTPQFDRFSAFARFDRDGPEKIGNITRTYKDAWTSIENPTFWQPFNESLGTFCINNCDGPGKIISVNDSCVVDEGIQLRPEDPIFDDVDDFWEDVDLQPCPEGMELNELGNSCVPKKLGLIEGIIKWFNDVFSSIVGVFFY